jgi:hypothetical protein
VCVDLLAAGVYTFRYSGTHQSPSVCSGDGAFSRPGVTPGRLPWPRLQKRWVKSCLLPTQLDNGRAHVRGSDHWS